MSRKCEWGLPGGGVAGCGVCLLLRPPVPVGVDASGQSIPGEVPKLFGGDVVEYLTATGSEIPLIVASCIRAIDKEGETVFVE